MTLIESTPVRVRPIGRPMRERVRPDGRGRPAGRARTPGTGPWPSRPGGAPLAYRSAGVPMSRAGHRPRPISPAATVGLALLAGLITVWLGLVAQFGTAAAGPPAMVPDQLGVVRVAAGENLQQLAARVAPGAPTGEVVHRIRELNRLDSAAVQAGQTLIAPLG